MPLAYVFALVCACVRVVCVYVCVHTSVQNESKTADNNGWLCVRHTILLFSLKFNRNQPFGIYTIYARKYWFLWLNNNNNNNNNNDISKRKLNYKLYNQASLLSTWQYINICSHNLAFYNRVFKPYLKFLNQFPRASLTLNLVLAYSQL